MSIDELVRVCAPPDRAVHVPNDAQWRALEAAIGVTFPADYRAYTERYGSGCFGAGEDDGFFDLAYLLTPGAPADKHGQNAIPRMKEETETMAEMRAARPKRVTVPVFPEPGGILYAGGTTTQHCLFWKTDGAPDAWTTMACDRACHRWYAHAGDITSLLAAIVTREAPDWIVAGPTRFPLVFRDIEWLKSATLT